MLVVVWILVCDIKLFLLDEFYEGFVFVIVQEIECILEGVKDFGMIIIIVEQNVIVVFYFVDCVVIFDMGEVVFDGIVQEVFDNVEFCQEYLVI